MHTDTWQNVMLGDVIKIKHGYPFKSELFSEELTGRPIVVAVGNFNYTGGFRFDSTATKEYRGTYPLEFELEPGDVLLVMTCQTAGGEILGIPGKIPDDGRGYLHNQRLGKVVVKQPDKVSIDFLCWLFLWREFNQELSASSSGTKIVHTAPSRIEAFRFALPSIEEQRAIARILGALDDKIELNREMNRTLEAMAQSLFKSWFVDFDPVTAWAAGRQPFGMSAHTAALFPARFVESELGLIPEGWKTGKIREVGRNPRLGVRPNEVSPDTPYIGLEHIPRKSITLSEWGKASNVISGKFKFKTGEILFGKLRPYFHKVGIAPVDGVCSTDVLVVNAVSQEWFGVLLGHLSSIEFINYVDGASGGTRMPRTDWDVMARHDIIIPKPEVASKYTELVNGLIAKTHANIFESHTLAVLRDALLPKLLSGEIHVRAAEELVAALI